MRRRWLTLGPWLVVFLAPGCGEEDRTFIIPEQCAAPDEPVADLVLDDLDGRKYDLEDDRCRNMVLIEFGATWCGWCDAGFPRLDAWHEKYERHGLRVISVDVREDPEIVRAYHAERGTAFRVLLDERGKYAYLWYVSGIPVYVLVSEEGEEIMRQVGYSEEGLDALEAEIVVRLGM